MTRRLVIVTGGSKGIGKELVSQYASNGKAVLYLSRTECESFSGPENTGKVFHLKVDLGQTEDTLEKLGRWISDHPDFEIECLVHNAAVLNLARSVGFSGSNRDSDSFQQIELQKFRDSYAVNVITPLMITSFLRQRKLFVRSEAAAVIYVTSSAARDEKKSNFPGLDLYSASKAALNKHASLQREEFRYDSEFQIRVVRLYPGIVDTEMQTELREDKSHLEETFKQNIGRIKDFDPLVDWRENKAPGNSAKRRISAKESANFVFWVSTSMRATNTFNEMPEEIDYYICEEYHQQRSIPESPAKLLASQALVCSAAAAGAAVAANEQDLDEEKERLEGEQKSGAHTSS